MMVLSRATRNMLTKTENSSRNVLAPEGSGNASVTLLCSFCGAISRGASPAGVSALGEVFERRKPMVSVEPALRIQRPELSSLVLIEADEVPRNTRNA